MQTTGKQYIIEVKTSFGSKLKSIGIGAGLAAGAMGIGIATKGSGPTTPAPQKQVTVTQPQTPVAPPQTTTPTVVAPKTPEKKVEKPANMIHHDAIQSMVKQDEGLRTKCYRCTSGKLTVGYGHNLETPKSKETFRKAFGDQGEALHAATVKGTPLSKEQADKLFTADYDEHLSRTKKLIPNLETHPPEVQSALVSGVYRGHVSDSPSFRKMFNTGDYEGAAKEFLNRGEYKNPKVAKGVKTRLERDQKIFADYANKQKAK
jgi:GH24 family phage-related lysozyme (muramidase)